MTDKLITICSTSESEHEGSVVRNYDFKDGTRFTDVTLKSGDDPLIVVQYKDGSLVEDVQHGRYPFSHRVAQMAINHFNETGELPHPIV